MNAPVNPNFIGLVFSNDGDTTESSFEEYERLMGLLEKRAFGLACQSLPGWRIRALSRADNLPEAWPENSL